MNLYAFFIINVLAIAWAVALLEIIIEKDQGWGAGHPKHTWYGKIIGQNSRRAQALAKILGVPHLFGYLVVMYGFIIPLVLVTEYFLLLPNVFLLVASYFAICLVEDFSWFVFNWHFDSLRQLLKGPHGKIWWHQKWVKLFREIYLPRVYFSGAALSLLFLIIASFYK